MSLTAPLKPARIEARATVEQKTVIERAAALEGRTVSEFVLSTAVERAEAVIERQRVLRLSDEAFDDFMRTLDEPPQVIPELDRLLRRAPVWADPEAATKIERIAEDVR
ncbi:DUF1778 domain-containing protein [Humibacter sp.]|jgi:uncharacterized protein (DUF1778 family)|uniref:type II toxin-antitoxin system TacA family antitoxin n=1 Tax=Humibacter sp. TaxID=1940291 RepID=UPI003F800560